VFFQWNCHKNTLLIGPLITWGREMLTNILKKERQRKYIVIMRSFSLFL